MRLTVHVLQLKLGLLRRLSGFEPDASDAGLACGSLASPSDLTEPLGTAAAPFRGLLDADSIAAYYMRIMEIASIVLLAHRANAGNRGGVRRGSWNLLGKVHRRHRPEAREAEDPCLTKKHTRIKHPEPT